jgi:hypothetical protein
MCRSVSNNGYKINNFVCRWCDNKNFKMKITPKYNRTKRPFYQSFGSIILKERRKIVKSNYL